MINIEKMQQPIQPKIKIPEWELDLSFARSSGPGGQKVNKASTKAILHFNIDKSKTLGKEQKEMVRKKLANRINEKGEIVLFDQSSRSQWQNRRNVIKRLNELINTALIPEKERKPTKIPETVKRKRLEEKRRRARIKESRRRIELE